MGYHYFDNFKNKKMKKNLLLFLGLLLVCFVQAQPIGPNAIMQNDAVKTGVELGAVIAVVTSWSRNNSIFWAIIHGILSWIYVIYFALTRE